VGAGAPDIDTPRAASDAGIAAISAGLTTYAGAAGILSLRERVAERFGIDKSMAVTADDVFVSAGAKLTLFCALSAIAEPGGNVVYATPHYGGYPHLIRRAGLDGRPVTTTAADGYRLDPERLADQLDERTVAVILNAPSNPTGAVYSCQELSALVEAICVNSSALIISDEIYAAFAYDEAPASVAAVASPDRVVVVDGVSGVLGVASQGESPALVQEVDVVAGARDTLPQPQVGPWAVRNGRPGVEQEGHLPFVNVDGVGDQGPRSQNSQVGQMVDRSLAGALGEGDPVVG
jgi:aspartate aminotransferase